MRGDGESSNFRWLAALSLLWLDNGSVVIAEICQRAFATARTLEDANVLSMTEQPFMEVVDAARIVWKQGLKQVMRGFSADFAPDKP